MKHNFRYFLFRLLDSNWIPTRLLGFQLAYVVELGFFGGRFKLYVDLRRYLS
jgi:hypothetical protein